MNKKLSVKVVLSVLSVLCIPVASYASTQVDSLAGASSLSLVTSGTLAKINSNTALNEAMADEEAAKAKFEKAKESYMEAAHKIVLIKSGKATSSSFLTSPAGAPPFGQSIGTQSFGVLPHKSRSYSDPEIISLSGFRGKFTAELSTGTGSVINVHDGSVIRHGWSVKTITPSGIQAEHKGHEVTLGFQNGDGESSRSESRSGSSAHAYSHGGFTGMQPHIIQPPVMGPPSMNEPSMPKSTRTSPMTPPMFGGGS